MIDDGVSGGVSPPVPSRRWTTHPFEVGLLAVGEVHHAALQVGALEARLAFLGPRLVQIPTNEDRLGLRFRAFR